MCTFLELQRLLIQIAIRAHCEALFQSGADLRLAVKGGRVLPRPYKIHLDLSLTI